MAPEPSSGADSIHDGPAPNAAEALRLALNVLDKKALLDVLHKIIENNPIVQRSLERSMLVPGKDVVRYHADTDSEDGENCENGKNGISGESEEESFDRSNEGQQTRKPIMIRDDEVTGRIAMCLNCDKRFNVTQNERGDCVWHDGTKDVDYGNDFWADHDENCHGPCESFVDDDDYGEGFLWTCCETQGDNKGCHSTKHKADVNIVMSDEASAIIGTSKRKADEELPNPRIERVTAW